MYDPLKLNKIGYKHLQHTQEHQRDCNSIRLSPQKQNKQTWTKGTEVNSSKPSKESSYQWSSNYSITKYPLHSNKPYWTKEHKKYDATIKSHIVTDYI